MITSQAKQLKQWAKDAGCTRFGDKKLSVKTEKRNGCFGSAIMHVDALNKAQSAYLKEKGVFIQNCPESNFAILIN